MELQTIEHMIEDNCVDGEIPLPNVTSKILVKVIKYCKKHVEANYVDENLSEDELKAWDDDFVKLDQATLFDLILPRDGPLPRDSSSRRSTATPPPPYPRSAATSSPPQPVFCCDAIVVSSSRYLATKKSYLVLWHPCDFLPRLALFEQRLCFVSKNVLSKIENGGKCY
ncbi:hypothetical protein GYH30_009830 [Glycine max]|nr:hypothetical protein GYH30_009830 [Glycine max]